MNDILFGEVKTTNLELQYIGNDLSIKVIGSKNRGSVQLYCHGQLIKMASFRDKVEKRLFIVEVINLGAKKSYLAKALNCSRQGIDNILNIYDHFGAEGLVHGYTPQTTPLKSEQRKSHEDKLIHGAKLDAIPATNKDLGSPKQEFFQWDKSLELSKQEQPFNEKHDWEKTRYAGIFVYLITLISSCGWLSLIFKVFKKAYHVFLIFLLMTARNIRSIEQLKNIRKKEAGIILGLTKLPSLPMIWGWFYSASKKCLSMILLKYYFQKQIKTGNVTTSKWYIDGHLLPYTGKEKVHFSYNTQRRMPVPGQTNMVITDEDGNIVDFDIQEGKGDLRQTIKDIPVKWKNETIIKPIMVFDREGYGSEFFSAMTTLGNGFVTWDKFINKEELNSIDDTAFNQSFTFNSKLYRCFEDKKIFTYTDSKTNEEKTIILRRINLWNIKSNKRVCGLTNAPFERLTTKESAKAILHRWGASENTFKHIATRHPYHYHPGFKLSESEKQLITNPEIKNIEKMLKKISGKLTALYKKQGKDIERKILKNPGKITHKKIEELEKQIADLKKRKSELPEKIDVSTLEDYRSFQKIDNEGKTIFDFCTTSVWNARKTLVSILGQFYKNTNEVVDLFYAITHCHGWIKVTDSEVTVIIEPIEQESRRLAQIQFCRKLSSLGSHLPNGKLLKIDVGDEKSISKMSRK